ncbi:MAG TPA: M1 family aminopeptidase [Urbifossiella sp.]|nr:M1 family aminopeptidase [Urbifossiella sp.]
MYPARLAAADSGPGARRPNYDLQVSFDQVNHRIHIRETVTWANPTRKPLDQLVFNFYPHYRVPTGDYLRLSKMLELMRVQPTQAIDRGGRHGVIGEARLLASGKEPLRRPEPLHYEFDEESPTTLRFPLPKPIQPGETATVEIGFCLHLPNKQGRWGYWKDVTFATNAIPLLAFCDDSGWHPAPFVPWGQPWFNEAGIFRATFDMPADEVLACPALIKAEGRLHDGRKLVETEPFLGRDFSFLCSPRFQEFRNEATLPDGRVLPLRCLAFSEHEHYATEMLKIVADAIPVYSEWFAPFPHPQFTLVESFFGWNGNEFAGMVMIDERVFAMPHLGRNYVEYLVSHETCHQWWYDLIGTNGFAEPFMDEGAAAYFTHRMLDRRHGKNNTLFVWPKELGWLPNVHREDYRWASMYAAIRNGQMHPAAQDLPNYRNVYGLFTGAYDRGSKVYGMIEDRLGEAAFMDFIHALTAKYSWKILRAADLKRELEEYTGRDWGEFFDRWVYGKGVTDWEVKSVKVDNTAPYLVRINPLGGAAGEKSVTVILKQKREFTEPTVLGIRFPGDDGFPVRIPIQPGAGTYRIPLPPEMNLRSGAKETEVVVESLGSDSLKVSFTYLGMDDPAQIAVDPDNVLLDANPGNNVWKPQPSARLTPLYTMLDETDLTSAQDRWNFTGGPWMWGATYPDPWYTRSTMIGLRAGANRPQEFLGGAYAAYRTDFRDMVFGVDGRWLGNMEETGFNYERRIAGPFGSQDGSSGPQRASVYHRWTIFQTPSMYLSPMMYHETFASYSDNFLPFARTESPGAVRWNQSWNYGWHFRTNLYSPYWNPESGLWFDASANVSEIRMPSWTTAGQFRTELAAVQRMPDGLGYFSNARVAARMVGMGALPDQGQFFALGGGTLFRGYDLAQRQGSNLWVGNLEMRIPIAPDMHYDVLDHTVGARSLWFAGFYDVGDVYANGHEVGGRIAQAVGCGLRVDVAIFSFIERATFRFDIAKTINDNTPVQLWFGMQNAF